MVDEYIQGKLIIGVHNYNFLLNIEYRSMKSIPCRDARDIFLPSQYHPRSLSNFIRFHKPKPTLKNNYFFKTEAPLQALTKFPSHPIHHPLADRAIRVILCQCEASTVLASSQSSVASICQNPCMRFILPSSVDSISRRTNEPPSKSSTPKNKFP